MRPSLRASLRELWATALCASAGAWGRGLGASSLEQKPEETKLFMNYGSITPLNPLAKSFFFCEKRERAEYKMRLGTAALFIPFAAMAVCAVAEKPLCDRNSNIAQGKWIRITRRLPSCCQYDQPRWLKKTVDMCRGKHMSPGALERFNAIKKLAHAKNSTPQAALSMGETDDTGSACRCNIPVDVCACSAKVDEWEWEPESCRLPPFDPHEFCQILGNRTILFIVSKTRQASLFSLRVSCLSLPPGRFDNFSDAPAACE